MKGFDDTLNLDTISGFYHIYGVIHKFLTIDVNKKSRQNEE